jgi:hypothetical protein
MAVPGDRLADRLTAIPEVTTVPEVTAKLL